MNSSKYLDYSRTRLYKTSTQIDKIGAAVSFYVSDDKNSLKTKTREPDRISANVSLGEAGLYHQTKPAQPATVAQFDSCMITCNNGCLTRKGID